MDYTYVNEDHLPSLLCESRQDIKVGYRFSAFWLRSRVVPVLTSLKLGYP